MVKKRDIDFHLGRKIVDRGLTRWQHRISTQTVRMNDLHVVSHAHVFCTLGTGRQKLDYLTLVQHATCIISKRHLWSYMQYVSQ